MYRQSQLTSSDSIWGISTLNLCTGTVFDHPLSHFPIIPFYVQSQTFLPQTLCRRNNGAGAEGSKVTLGDIRGGEHVQGC